MPQRLENWKQMETCGQMKSRAMKGKLSGAGSAILKNLRIS